MTQNQKHKRAVADLSKLLQDVEKRREFATELFLIEHTIKEARLNDMVFDAHMMQAEKEWKTT